MSWSFAFSPMPAAFISAAISSPSTFAFSQAFALLLLLLPPVSSGCASRSKAVHGGRGYAGGGAAALVSALPLEEPPRPECGNGGHESRSAYADIR